MDKAFIRGTGNGQPLGILNAGCTVTASKVSGQASGTIVYNNLTRMLRHLHPACFANSVWIAAISALPALMSVYVPIGTDYGTSYPVLAESNGTFKMLTRPLIFTEKLGVAVGTKGDLLLADFSQYVIGIRKEMRLDRSEHLYFQKDQTAFRGIVRVDGQPLWNEPLTLEDNSLVGPFVVLEAR